MQQVNPAACFAHQREDLLGGQDSGLLVAPDRVAIGLAAGIPSALALGRYVSSQLYGIQSGDPRVAVGTIVVLALVPARAATTRSPVGSIWVTTG